MTSEKRREADTHFVKWEVRVRERECTAFCRWPLTADILRRGVDSMRIVGIAEAHELRRIALDEGPVLR
jgi:hypothetical protein